MKISKIRELLGAEIVCGEETEEDFYSAFGSDMMSDVLAFVKDQSVLITGLCNPQAIRTAEMMDIVCLICVRGKTPDENMLSMAEDRELVVLSTNLTMFTACGMLYDAGLRGGTSIG